MTTPQTPVPPVAAPKPRSGPSLAAKLLDQIIYSLIWSICFTLAYNNSVVGAYGVKELSVSVAFVFFYPIILVAQFIRNSVKDHLHIQRGILREQILIADSHAQLVAAATLDSQNIGRLVNNTYAIAASMLDIDPTVNYNSATVNEGTQNGSKEQAN